MMMIYYATNDGNDRSSITVKYRMEDAEPCTVRHCNDNYVVIIEEDCSDGLGFDN